MAVSRPGSWVGVSIVKSLMGWLPRYVARRSDAREAAGALRGGRLALAELEQDLLVARQRPIPEALPIRTRERVADRAPLVDDEEPHVVVGDQVPRLVDRRKEVADVVGRLWGHRTLDVTTHVVPDAVLAHAEAPLAMHPMIRVAEIRERQLELLRIQPGARNTGQRDEQQLAVELLDVGVGASELRHLRAAERASHPLREPDDDVLLTAEILETDLRALGRRQSERRRRFSHGDCWHRRLPPERF